MMPNDPRAAQRPREPTKRSPVKNSTDMSAMPAMQTIPALPVSPERSPSPIASDDDQLQSSIEIVESHTDPLAEAKPEPAQNAGEMAKEFDSHSEIFESIEQLERPEPEHTEPESVAVHNGLTESMLATVANVPSSPATAGPNDSNDDWAISSVGGAEPILSLDDDDDDDEDDHDEPLSEHGPNGAPRLVMPRMMLAQSRGSSPRRQMGKLKVLVAGRRGTGKSRLIDSLISECDVISHATEAHGIGNSKTLSERRASTSTSTDHNLAFVDSHGWAAEDELADYVGSVTDYLDALYQETASLVNGLNPASLQILAQSTSLAQFPHVDVCLYLLHNAQLAADDVVALRAIEPYAAIVPVIAHVDSLGLTASQLFDRKIELANALRSAGISCLQLHGNSHHDDDGLPYAISTTLQYNLDMTASAVMAEGYRTHILVESDLARLTSRLLSATGARAARTLTAQKLVEWVATLHVRSTLVHSRPLLAPRQFVLDLSDAFAQVDEDASAAGCTASRASRSIARRHETFALSVAHGLRRHRCASFKSIENIDPLDLSGWSRAIKILAALAAATAVATLGALGLRWVSPPPPPPPCRAERARDIMNHWGLLLRVTLAT